MLTCPPLASALRLAAPLLVLVPSLALAQQTAGAPAPRRSTATFDQIKQSFNAWLGVQEIYPKSQVPVLRQQFDDKVKSLSGPELQTWLDGMDAKLTILAGPQARAARQWLSYFASPSVVLPERSIRSFDIINNTPEQVQQALDDVDARRQGRAVRSEAFDAARRQQVDWARQDQVQQRQFEQDMTLTRMAQTNQSFFPETGAAHSPYAPQQRPRPELPKGPTMYVSPWGGVGFVLNR